MDERDFEEVIKERRSTIIALRNIICDAFNENEFADLLYLNLREFDWFGLPKSLSFIDRVFDVIHWVNRRGDTAQILWLARIAMKERPKRNDLKQVCEKLEKMIQSDEVIPSQQASVNKSLPQDLTTLLALTERNLIGLVMDLRPSFRTNKYEPYDIPGRFHLDASQAYRLLAVLALEWQPHASYVRWLSERVTVEKPLVGFTAAQALTTAALRIPRLELPTLRAQLKDASDRLDEIIETEDKIGMAHGCDISSRKRQVQAAASIVELRLQNTYHCAPKDLDDFLDSFATSFDKDTIDRVCRLQLNTQLKFLANPDDPIELIVAHLVVTAHEKRWLFDLVRAVYTEHNSNQSFARMLQASVIG